jgi:hypothetical protein
MKIITINNNEVTLHEGALLIPEFKILWENNKNGIELFKYIYLFADYNSPYKAYDEEQKIVALKKDLGITLTQELKDAIEKYKSLNYTFNMRYLDDALHAANQTRAYFRTVDYSLVDSRGGPVYKVNDVHKALGDCMKVIISLEQMRDKVEAESIVNSKIRGGAKVNKWEQ